MELKDAQPVKSFLCNLHEWRSPLRGSLPGLSSRPWNSIHTHKPSIATGRQYSRSRRISEQECCPSEQLASLSGGGVSRFGLYLVVGDSRNPPPRLHR